MKPRETPTRTRFDAHPRQGVSEMRMDRNIPGNRGKGKYALVRLRHLHEGRESYAALNQLADHGFVDWGCVGDADEFFVIKLRDKFAAEALKAYADAAINASAAEADPEKAKALAVWALQVQSLAARAGELSPFCKLPD